MAGAGLWCGPAAHPVREDAGRQAERQRVQGQGPVRPERRDQAAAGQEAGDLAELGGVAPDHAAQPVLVPGQYLGQERRPGRREWRAEQDGAEEQHAQPGERHPRTAIRAASPAR